MRLAVIPARGGSKRIERKNIRLFAGKPIIAYSIQAALQCSAIDEVWVSTEDHEIASVARDWGAKVPFMRPESLADDHTVMQAVMTHALEQARQKGLSVTEACLVFATAPFIQSEDIARGLQCLLNSKADLALAVTQFRAAPQRAQTINTHGLLKYSSPEYCDVRSQDLEPLFHDAAQFVWGTCHGFTNTTVTNANVAPVVIENNCVIDIDTPEDWEFAEKLSQVYSPTSLNTKQAA